VTIIKQAITKDIVPFSLLIDNARTKPAPEGVIATLESMAKTYYTCEMAFTFGSERIEVPRDWYLNAIYAHTRMMHKVMTLNRDDFTRTLHERLFKGSFLFLELNFIDALHRGTFGFFSVMFYASVTAGYSLYQMFPSKHPDIYLATFDARLNWAMRKLDYAKLAASSINALISTKKKIDSFFGKSGAEQDRLVSALPTITDLYLPG
jgi:hypothetical protein